MGETGNETGNETETGGESGGEDDEDDDEDEGEDREGVRGDYEERGSVTTNTTRDGEEGGHGSGGTAASRTRSRGRHRHNSRSRSRDFDDEECGVRRVCSNTPTRLLPVRTCARGTFHVRFYIHIYILLVMSALSICKRTLPRRLVRLIVVVDCLLA